MSGALLETDVFSLEPSFARPAGQGESVVRRTLDLPTKQRNKTGGSGLEREKGRTLT